MNFYEELSFRTLNDFDMVDLQNLEKFLMVIRKNCKNNNFYLMHLIRLLSPIKIFHPVTILLTILVQL